MPRHFNIHMSVHNNRYTTLIFSCSNHIVKDNKTLSFFGVMSYLQYFSSGYFIF